MPVPPVRRSALPQSVLSRVVVPRWRKREVVASAVIAVTSVFIILLAWMTPQSLPLSLLQTAIGCGGLAAARAPRILFLPTALRDARGVGLVVPLSALRLAQIGQVLLAVAAGCWLWALFS